MKLRTLAVSNIRHNFKKYAMYFFSLCFTVFTAYAFLGLTENESVAAAFAADTRYRVLLITFGIIIGVFVLFFMLNANNSFIRARKKEISMYSLFGIPNKKIGKLLFLETIMVGGLALIVGIAFGMFFSKLIAMVLIRMTVPEYVGRISFGISAKSIFATAGIFFLFFCALGLSGLRVIKRFELVDLFRAEKAAEKKPRGSWILLALSVICIGYGYYLATVPDSYKVVNSTILIIGLVIAGTYLFFIGGFTKALNIFKKNKKKYYRAVNLVAVSGFSHRIRSIGTAMATIAVLSAVATTAIATGFSLYSSTEKNAYESTGYDLYFYGGQDKVLQQIHRAIEDEGAEITQEKTVQRYFTEPEIEPLILGGNQYFNEKDIKVRVYSMKGYNELIGISKSDIKLVGIDNKYDAVYVMPYLSDDLDKAMMGRKIRLGDATISIADTQKCMFASFGAWHMFVLSDELFDELLAVGVIKDRYDGADMLDKATVINHTKSMSAALNAKLKKILGGNVSGYRIAYDHYSESLRIFGLVRFIGFFMSAVVILMTASMLYFKQIMAAEEEKHLYSMLRKIGMDERMQKKVIAKRLLPVFFIPLLVGIIHSVFAMKSADTMVFENMIAGGNSYLTVLGFSSVMYAAYAVVYAIFYLITKSQYMRTVRG